MVEQRVNDDRDAAGILCRAGRTQLVAAPAEDLRRLRRVVSPVYAWLRRDPETAQFLHQIDRERSEVKPGGREAIDCDSVGNGTALTPSATSTPLDGTWEVHLSHQEMLALDPDVVPENWGDFVYVFSHGHFVFTQENAQACGWGYGSFAATDDRVEWLFGGGGGYTPTGAVNKPGEDFEFSYRRAGSTLTLGAVQGAISPPGVYLKPWHLLVPRPDPGRLASHCLPPPQALRGLRGTSSSR
jgi:hypothetical protein